MIRAFPSNQALVTLAIVFFGFGGVALADDQPLKLEDPFAAVDGQPITVGRLNLVLQQRFPKTAPDQLPPRVRQATALVLVRQQMALNQLRQLGGAAIEAQMSAAVDRQVAESKRRGISLAQQAAAKQSDERALADQIRWQTAWAAYLRSRLTEKNLRGYFETHRDRYEAESWDDLADRGPIRRHAADALFEVLVRGAKDAKIVWFSKDLEPPTGFQARIE